MILILVQEGSTTMDNNIFEDVNDAFPSVSLKKGEHVLTLMSKDSDVKENEYDIVLSNGNVSVVLEVAETYEDMLEFMNIITMAYAVVGYDKEIEV